MVVTSPGEDHCPVLSDAVEGSRPNLNAACPSAAAAANQSHRRVGRRHCGHSGPPVAHCNAACVIKYIPLSSTQPSFPGRLAGPTLERVCERADFLVP
jgi:hypothetical protein